LMVTAAASPNSDQALAIGEAAVFPSQPDCHRQSLGATGDPPRRQSNLTLMNNE